MFGKIKSLTFVAKSKLMGMDIKTECQRHIYFTMIFRGF